MSNTAPRGPHGVSPPTQSAPAGAVQSPLAQVIAMSELEVGRSGEADAGHYPGARMPALVDVLSNVQHPLRRVKAKLTVCVGTVELSIGELLGAQEQHVLRLDRSIEQPVDVLLEGQVVARGTLVAVDDHFAVRITELPVSFDAAANPACTT